ncbi:MAG: alpha amylase C-terminal domain-containing protein [Firmicutes bacterium]|nr:alpha amylase C-terminal domain-containing protein [Bacillota bacterium]
MIIAVNMTPEPRHGRPVPVPLAGRWTEILNTDAALYGGGGLGNQGGVDSKPIDGAEAIDLTLPPLAAVFLRYEGPHA